MDGARTLPDPLNDEPECWVTVDFDRRMAVTHWDEDLLKYYIRVVQTGGGEIGFRSRLGIACKCLSLPITGVPIVDGIDVRRRAVRIAEGWCQRVLAKQVWIDRERIFFRRGKPTSPPEVLEEGGLF